MLMWGVVVKMQMLSMVGERFILKLLWTHTEQRPTDRTWEDSKNTFSHRECRKNETLWKRMKDWLYLCEGACVNPAPSTLNSQQRDCQTLQHHRQRNSSKHPLSLEQRPSPPRRQVVPNADMAAAKWPHLAERCQSSEVCLHRATPCPQPWRRARHDPPWELEDSVFDCPWLTDFWGKFMSAPWPYTNACCDSTCPQSKTSYQQLPNQRLSVLSGQLWSPSIY